MADKDTAPSQIDASMAKFADAEYMAALDLVQRRQPIEPRVGTPEREVWQRIRNRRASAMLDAAVSLKGSNGEA